jgi:GAF domain-containing protein
MADNKADLFAFLLERVGEALEGNDEPDRKLGRVCRVLADGWTAFDWVGFYRLAPETRELVLGPFAGEATEHERIPYGRGICGRVAETQTTYVAADVDAESNYLACSARVRSEIVVPIFFGGAMVAQLDIDSHTPDAFGDEERRFLEEVAEELGEAWEG